MIKKHLEFLKDCNIIVEEFEKDSKSERETIGRMAYELYKLRKQVKETK